jgi:hypothetical protein
VICLQGGDQSDVIGLPPPELESSGPCRGLLVNAESEQARGFYEHLIPEFKRSPTDPLHLLLLLKEIRRTLGSRPRLSIFRDRAQIADPVIGRPWWAGSGAASASTYSRRGRPAQEQPSSTRDLVGMRSRDESRSVGHPRRLDNAQPDSELELLVVPG